MIVNSVEEYQHTLPASVPLARLEQVVHDLRNCTNNIMAMGQLLVDGDSMMAEQVRRDDSRLIGEARSIGLILTALLEDELIQAALAQDEANQQSPQTDQ